MAGFVDRALLQLHDPAALRRLLTNNQPGPYDRLRRLVTAVFENESATVDQVLDASVLSTAPMVGIPLKHRVQGTLTTTQPAYARSELCGDLQRTDGPWAHLMARLVLRVAIAVDGAAIDSVIISSIDDITDLNDFASRFRYLDLPAFLAAHRIETVEQLREAAQYLLAEIRLKQPPAFDPNDPANAYDVRIDLALTVMEELDLSAGLIAAQQLVSAGAGRSPGPSNEVLGTARNAFAVATVFPRLQGGQVSVGAVDALFAKAGVLPLFANPP